MEAEANRCRPPPRNLIFLVCAPKGRLKEIPSRKSNRSSGFLTACWLVFGQPDRRGAVSSGTAATRMIAVEPRLIGPRNSLRFYPVSAVAKARANRLKVAPQRRDTVPRLENDFSERRGGKKKQGCASERRQGNGASVELGWRLRAQRAAAAEGVQPPGNAGRSLLGDLPVENSQNCQVTHWVILPMIFHANAVWYLTE